MIKKTISQEDVITLMNELLNIDYKAMNNLIKNRVKCNNQIANHPTVQVSVNENKEYFVGLLGILNGLFGVDDNGIGCFAIFMNDKGDIHKFNKTSQIDKEIKNYTKSLSKKDLVKECKDISNNLLMWTKQKRIKN